MSPECSTCHKQIDADGPIRHLAELGFGKDHEDRKLYLCDDCLERRETGSWSLLGEDGQRLYDALHETDRPAKERYSYLLEPDEAIHLVRLRPGWVDQHAHA